MIRRAVLVLLSLSALVAVLVLVSALVSECRVFNTHKDAALVSMSALLVDAAARPSVMSAARRVVKGAGAVSARVPVKGASYDLAAGALLTYQDGGAVLVSSVWMADKDGAPGSVVYIGAVSVPVPVLVPVSALKNFNE